MTGVQTCALPISKEDCELILNLNNIFGKNIGFQPIGPVGRAKDFLEKVNADINTYDKTPCPSTGLLIQPFGTAVSCCAPLSHEDYDHPLRLGNAFSEPIAEIILKWRTNPLLQTNRLWGFEPIINWLIKEQFAVDKILKDKTCQTCVALFQDSTACNIAYKNSNKFMNKLSLALSLKKYFGEEYLEEVIKKEAQRQLST